MVEPDSKRAKRGETFKNKSDKVGEYRSSRIWDLEMCTLHILQGCKGSDVLGEGSGSDMAS